MKCFGCGENGHLVRACPKSLDNPDKTALIVISENVSEVRNDIAAVVAERPGTSRAPVVPKK